MTINYPLLLLLIPIALIVIILSTYRWTELFIPQVNKEKRITINAIKYIPEAILGIAITILIIAAAQPIQITKETNTDVYGVSIMLVIDMSESMLAEDFKPKNRFTASIETIKQFTMKRTNDLLGIVVFGSEAFLVSPLTNNSAYVVNRLSNLAIGQISGQTAIGDGLITALNHLEKSKTKSKVVILLTDGENNAGETDPITAAHLANALDIKVYTIGMGKKGGAPIPYNHPVYGKQYYKNQDGSLFLTKIDEDTLTKISTITNGLYFRATNEKRLSLIYKEINKLEKSKVIEKVAIHKESKHKAYIIIGAILLGLYAVLKHILWRTAL